MHFWDGTPTGQVRRSQPLSDINQAIRRHYSTENQLLASSLPSTTLAIPAARSISLFSPSMRLPRLGPDQHYAPPTQRRKVRTGLTPHISFKTTGTLLSPDDYEGDFVCERLEASKTSVSTIDFVQKLNRRIQHLSANPTPREDQPRPQRDLTTVAEISKRTDQCDERKAGNYQAKVAYEGWKVKKRKQREIAMPAELKPTAAQLAAINSFLHSFLSRLILRSSGLTSTTAEPPYRFFLGPGNNSQLIAFLMKRRPYWTRVENWQQADFVWTQNRQSEIVDSLPLLSQEATLLEHNDERLPALPNKPKSLQTVMEGIRAKSGVELIEKSPVYLRFSPFPASATLCVYNRLDRNYQLTSKKRLFTNLSAFYSAEGKDVFQSIPLTFLIQSGPSDPEFDRFVQYFQALQAEAAVRTEKPKLHNIWIVKPGENTNCGHGIHVSSDLAEIRELISATVTPSGRKRTYIVQKYIERPFLVNRRKFDIRCYGLLTCFNGHTQGYFYHDGYLRTSSKEFSLKNVSNRFIHLTNDAVQKKSEDYGKFESGNKMSYPEFQRYLDANCAGKVDFWMEIWPQIRTLMTDTFRATHRLIDPLKRLQTFEVLGYDFMIDEKFKVWLIEVNTNPCLALSSAYLAKLIPEMLDNAFRIALDPLFPAAGKKKQTETGPCENKFELVFSSLCEQKVDVEQSMAVSEASEGSEETQEDEA